jgi:hypothetical protein
VRTKPLALEVFLTVPLVMAEVVAMPPAVLDFTVPFVIAEPWATSEP